MTTTPKTSKRRPGLPRRGLSITENRAAQARPAFADNLLKHRSLDGAVSQCRIAPPPSIALHGARRRDEPIDNGGEVGIAVVEAEDQTAGADPAQQQSFRAEVILQHPMVARPLR